MPSCEACNLCIDLWVIYKSLHTKMNCCIFTYICAYFSHISHTVLNHTKLITFQTFYKGEEHIMIKQLSVILYQQIYYVL